MKNLSGKIEVQYIAGKPMFLYWNEIVPRTWTLMGMSEVPVSESTPERSGSGPRLVN